MDARFVLEVLQDVELELSDPEVSELITLALDRKIEQAISQLKEELNLD